MNSLIDKMRKGRESVIEFDGFKLTIRRPTDLDFADRPDAGTARDHMLFWTRYVVGWDGIKEMDLFPGGGGDPVPFDLESFQYWFEDQPDHWEKLIYAVRGSYTQWHERKEEESKN